MTETVAQSFDGLDKDSAIRLCVRRSDELSTSQVDFITRVGALKKPLNGADAARLTRIIEKFRQDDLVSHIRLAPHDE